MANEWNPISLCRQKDCTGMKGLGQGFDLRKPINLFDPSKFIGGYQVLQLSDEDKKFYTMSKGPDGTLLQTEYRFGTKDWASPVMAVQCPATGAQQRRA